MQILNFNFLTSYCYGFTDNDEVISSLCAEVLYVFCILFKNVSEKVVKVEMGGDYYQR